MSFPCHGAGGQMTPRSAVTPRSVHAGRRVEGSVGASLTAMHCTLPTSDIAARSRRKAPSLPWRICKTIECISSRGIGSWALLVQAGIMEKNVK